MGITNEETVYGSHSAPTFLAQKAPGRVRSVKTARKLQTLQFSYPAILGNKIEQFVRNR
jgi:hypothetical protein